VRRSSNVVRASLVGCVLAVGALALPTSLLAQPRGTPARTGGIWWSASAAAAGVRLACDLPCDTSRDKGPAIEAAFGTYATPAVRVGLDGGAWTFRDGDFRERVYTAGVMAEVHPRPGSGLHLIGGLGWTGYRAGDVDAEADELGFAYNAVRLRLGVGWDFPLWSAWSVGNRVTLDASSLGTLSDEGQPVAESVGLSVVRVGIYLRYR
jgi:hypothetical protein